MAAIILNSPNEAHTIRMQKLADFFDLYSIRYVQNYDDEDFVLTTKDGLLLMIGARSSRVDGGWISVKEPVSS